MTISNTYARTKGAVNGNGATAAIRSPRFKTLLLFGFMMWVVFIAGCGGGGSSSAITIQIIPGSTQNMDTGQSLNFMATLANDIDNKGVTWDFNTGCSGAGCGTLTNATPNSVTYTAPTGISANLAVTLKATSVAESAATATVTINVVLAPTFGTALPPNGANGVPYSFLIPITGGVSPLSVTLASGTLPAGLTLNQSGLINGTPSGANTTNTFTMQVADAGNPPIKVVSPQYTIKISAPPALSITSQGALLGATQNVAYSSSILTSGGVTPFTWSIKSGNLPPGLALNKTSGQITGVPTAAGVFTFTPQVTDSAIPLQTASTAAPLSITVTAPPPLAITPSVLPGGTVATPYASFAQATGGVLPYTWSVASGQLPAGLTLNTASGEITGTPIMVSSSPVTFTLQVQDSQTPPKQDTSTFNISIAAGSTSPNSLLSGSYVFFFKGFDTDGVVLTAGLFTANGSGSITSGTEDMNRVSGVTIAAKLTGSYSIGTDGFGTLTLTATNNVNQQLTSVYQFVLDSQGNARFFENDSSNATPPPKLTRGEGIIRRQIGSSFSTSSFSGNYAFGFTGQDLGQAPAALAGVIQADGVSTLSPGTIDFNDGGTYNPLLPTSGNFSLDGSGGRAGVTMIFQLPKTSQVTLTYIAYFVSPRDLFFIEIDATDATHPKIGGEMLLQQPTTVFNKTALNGPSVLTGSGLDTNASVFVGLLTSDSAGGGLVTFNQNDGGAISQGTAVPGTYQVTPNGRVAFTNFGALGPRMAAAYLTDVNQGFLIGSDPAATIGLVENQSGGPFNAASLLGSYALSAPVPADPMVDNVIGQVSGDGGHTMQGTVDDVNASGQPASNTLVGNYAVTPPGTGTMTTNSPAGIPTNLTVYVVSPRSIRMISTDPSDEHPQVLFFDH